MKRLVLDLTDTQLEKLIHRAEMAVTHNFYHCECSACLHDEVLLLKVREAVAKAENLS